MLKYVWLVCLLAGAWGAAYAQARFSDSTFSDSVNFLKGQVVPREASHKRDTLTFENDIFLKWADFYQTHFEPAVTFADDSFHSRAEFAEAVFREKVTFDGSTFMEGGNFVGARFEKTTDFSFVSLPDGAWLNFQQAQLPDTINFANLIKPKAEINLLEIAFDSARFGKGGNGHRYNIILYQSDVSKFRLDYNYFHFLPIEDQDGKELTRDEGIALYEDLLTNFRDHKQRVSAEKLDIEYQQYKWRTAPWYTSWFGIVADKWWQFGYAKHRVFGWTALLLVFFSLISLPMLPFLQKNIYPLEPLTRKEEAADGHPYRGLRRFWYSFVYTGTLFFKLSLETKNIRFDSRPRNILGTLYVLVVYMIGVVCLAYMANFVLQK